jgi:hypothetical protein
MEFPGNIVYRVLNLTPTLRNPELISMNNTIYGLTSRNLPYRRICNKLTRKRNTGYYYLSISQKYYIHYFGVVNRIIVGCNFRLFGKVIATTVSYASLK